MHTYQTGRTSFLASTCGHNLRNLWVISHKIETNNRKIAEQQFCFAFGGNTTNADVCTCQMPKKSAEQHAQCFCQTKTKLPFSLSRNSSFVLLLEETCRTQMCARAECQKKVRNSSASAVPQSVPRTCNESSTYLELCVSCTYVFRNGDTKAERDSVSLFLSRDNSFVVLLVETCLTQMCADAKCPKKSAEQQRKCCSAMFPPQQIRSSKVSRMHRYI